MLEELINSHPAVMPALALALLIVVAIIADLIVKRVLLVVITRIIRVTDRLGWGEALEQQNVYGRIAQAVPALIIYFGAELIPSLDPGLVQFLRNISLSYLVLVVTMTLSALLSAGNDIYERQPNAHERPLRGFIQLIQIVVYVFGGLLIISTLIDRSPLILLSGFGAMTAVLLLIFRDTILGLVASVQLNANNMVRIGDWIEMPKYGADGDVIEVSLHTVKVQNWDRTITTIPTHALIADSFRNWRGMSESGGRRIKRSLLIDQRSMRFLSETEVTEFGRFELLQPYLEHKRAELADALAQSDGDRAQTSAVNRRRLTNVGMFRAYIYAYLQQHPAINPDATLLVRHLPLGSQGLPIEVYCFTRTTDWLDYEGIQSDIFDHIIAITPEFDLRLFQEPGGADLSGLLDTRNGSDHDIDGAHR